MRVRCTRLAGTEAELRAAGMYPRQTFHVTVGREYLVFGVRFEIESSLYGTRTVVDVLTDHGHLVGCPLDLFEVIESSVSSHWRFAATKHGGACLWPELFFRPYFHDDLSDGASEACAALEQLKSQMEAEIPAGA